MALLRLSAAIALLASGACDAADAQAPATSGLTAPTGWRALPDLARAIATGAKADGVTVAGTDAWGETSRGCFAMWLALAGDGATAQHVIDSLAGEQLETRNVVKPDGEGIVTATFAKAPYTGRLRARVGAGKVTALACFANDREPGACDAACTQLLGGLP